MELEHHSLTERLRSSGWVLASQCWQADVATGGRHVTVHLALTGTRSVLSCGELVVELDGGDVTAIDEAAIAVAVTHVHGEPDG
jgi:hypothetical protein